MFASMRFAISAPCEPCGCTCAANLFSQIMKPDKIIGSPTDARPRLYKQRQALLKYGEGGRQPRGPLLASHYPPPWVNQPGSLLWWSKRSAFQTHLLLSLETQEWHSWRWPHPESQGIMVCSEHCRDRISLTYLTGLL